jgi:hypothetical protein
MVFFKPELQLSTVIAVMCDFLLFYFVCVSFALMSTGQAPLPVLVLFWSAAWRERVSSRRASLVTILIRSHTLACNVGTLTDQLYSLLDCGLIAVTILNN